MLREHSTPLYIYSLALMKRNFTSFDGAFGERPHAIHYALKANSNKAIVKTFADLGGGADVVSRGELYRALQSGIDPENIVFAGVGKTFEEIKKGLKKNILAFNVESIPELKLIAKIGKRIGKVAPVSMRINPGIDPGTDPYIATGLKESKFGVSKEKTLMAYRFIRDNTWLEAKGVHTHIGSQITSLEPFVRSAKFIQDFICNLATEGISLEFVDMGGGFGIPYGKEQNVPQRTEFVNSILESIDSKLKIIIEPGRSLVGGAGMLITRVIRTKESSGNRFTIVDAGMNDFVRPSLYNAHHEIIPVRNSCEKKARSDVVGPVCESGDFLGKNRLLPQTLGEGDYLAVMDVGAYGYEMSSNYNSRPRPLELLVKHNKFAVIRSKESFGDLTKHEVLPGFLR